MNKDIFEGNWKQVKGKIRTKWGKITDDELDQIKGNRDQFLGKIQEKYGVAREQAEKDLKDFEKSIAA